MTNLLLTGAHGFLGTAVLRALAGLPVTPWTPGSKDFDLRQPDHVERCFRWAQPQIVVHLACPYGGGGIGYAQAHPATLATGMVQMDSLLIEAAARHRVQAFIGVGSVCAYPETVTFPTGEDQLWLGHPEAVNASYGLAKRMQLTLLQAAQREWGLKGIHLILANLYGPGDHFGTGLRGHVIPSTILKIDQAQRAGDQEIVAWGDGSPTREFLYIDDAAAAVARVIAGVLDDHAYADLLSAGPINIVSGEEVTIRDVVYRCCAAMGYYGEVRWDASKPNGQYRRHFDNTKARALLGWGPRVSLAHGLEQTVAWFRAPRKES